MIFRLKIFFAFMIIFLYFFQTALSMSSKLYIHMKLYDVQQFLSKINMQYTNPSVVEIEKSAMTLNSFDEQKNVLNAIISSLQDLKRNFSQSEVTSKDIIETSSLKLSKLSLLGKENIPLIKYDDTTKTLLSPDTIQSAIKNYEKYIKKIWQSSKKLLSLESVSSLDDKIFVSGNVHFQKLYINNLKVNYLNEKNLALEKSLISQTDQNFSLPLQVKSVFIDDLEIPSLCGLKSDYWLIKNTTDVTSLKNVDFNSSFIYNDTITIKNETTLESINVKNVNNIDIKTFMNDIFLKSSKERVIKGNITFKNLVHTTKVSAKKINGISSESLITKYTNQTLNNVFIDTLEVNRLYADKINGLSLDNVARKSQANIIKGLVTVGSFVISNELMIKENIVLPLKHSIQVYDEIVIDGDVFIKNVEMDANATLLIGELLTSHNIYNTVKHSWCKTGHQNIEKAVNFENGMSIDKLSCHYLNGFSNEDFYYTDTSEIGHPGSTITFTNFHFNNVIVDDFGISQVFFEKTPNLLTFYKTIHVSYGSVNNVYMNSFNGIPVNIIMQQSNDTLKFIGVSEFETLYVEDRMTVDYLRIDQRNMNENLFEKALRTDENIQIDLLKIDSINIKNLLIKKLNGENLDEALRAQGDISNHERVKFLTVDGEIDVEKNLTVDKINKYDVNYYINNLNSNYSITDIIYSKNIKNLHLLENLNVDVLNGQRIDYYFESTLTKSTKQNFFGEFDFFNTSVNYLTTEIINNKNVSIINYADEPSTFYADTSFDELTVLGDIETATVENMNTSELKEKLKILSLKKVQNLTILGNMFWNHSSSQSLNFLFDNAITKHENQTLNCSVDFENPVVISSLYLEKEQNSIIERMEKIISDAVTISSNSNPIFIKSNKFFGNEFRADYVNVKNNIDIKNINGYNINEVAMEILQNYNSDTVFAGVTFAKHVEIANLVTHSKIHEVAHDELATYDEKMPDHMNFQNLVVKGNVTVYKLDQIIFDDFKKKRITINEDHEIPFDVEFTDSIFVKDRTFTSTVNSIKVKNIVTVDNTTNASNFPIIINGKKSFKSKLIVNNNVEAITINDLDLKNISDSFSNDDNIDIYGNLIFQADTEISSEISISEKINGNDAKRIIKIESLDENSAVRILNKTENSVDRLIKSNFQNLPNASVRTDSFLYLEQEDNSLWHLGEMANVKSTNISSTIRRIDVYATDTCGPENNCLCQSHNLQITPVTYEMSNDNDFGLDTLFEFKIVNERCPSRLSNETKILKNFVSFWIGKNASEYPLPRVDDSAVADARVFVIKDKIFLILAILDYKGFNNDTIKFFTYEINLQNNKIINSTQLLKTEGAKSVYIFQINNVGIYAFIGCVKGKVESLLLRYDSRIQQFQLVRTFTTGGSKHIASITTNNDTFIIINNPDIEALQIFKYHYLFDNFYSYQDLYFESRTTSLAVFNAGELSSGSDPFFVTTTKDGWFYMYEYMLYGKFQRKVSYWAEDIQILAPFKYDNENYLFGGSKFNNTIFKIIQQGFY